MSNQLLPVDTSILHQALERLGTNILKAKRSTSQMGLVMFAVVEARKKKFTQETQYLLSLTKNIGTEPRQTDICHILQYKKLITKAKW